jgi:hypothetical protein
MSTKINQNQNHEMKNSNLNDKKSYNESDYIHYVYKITNLTNNKYYIGVHSLLKDYNNTPLNDGYWGSGTLIEKTIRQEGRNNFKKEILKTFSTRGEAMEEEKRLVTIDVVNSPDSYNQSLGGINNMKQMGYVVVRLKSNLDKIIKIPREEYYRYKDLYIPTGHLKYYLKTKNMSKEELKDYKEKKQTSKRKEQIYKEEKISRTSKKLKYKKVGRIKILVNRDTLKIIKIHESEIDSNTLYNVWFPQYFLDKINNVFISEDYLIEKFNQRPNRLELSKSLGIARKSVEKLFDYYKSIDTQFNSKLSYDNGKRNRSNYKSKGFSGKIYVHKEDKEVVIEKLDLEKYVSAGWELGKLSNLNRNAVIDFYCQGNNTKICAKYFKVDYTKIRKTIGITEEFITKHFYKKGDTSGKYIRLQVNEYLESRLNENGWVSEKP